MFFGQFGEHFAVEQDVGFFELVNQFAVRHAIFSRGGVDFFCGRRMRGGRRAEAPPLPHAPLIFFAI